MSEDMRDVLADGSIAEPSGDVAVETPPSDTVTTADRWTRRTGARLAADWQGAGMANADDESMPFVAADAVETLMSPSPSLADNPADEHRARWWRQLVESPELAALRAQTVLAPALAEIAAAELAKQWNAYVAENPEPEPRDDTPDGPDGDDGESPEATVARIRSTRAALEQAREATNDAAAAAAGLGIDTGSTVDGRRIAQFAQRFKRDGTLARIMQLAGRWIARATQLQKQRVDLPGLEVTGVELSGDIERALPLEAALIAGAVPEIESLALYKMATRRTLSYRRERREPVAMGPIVVSVDESGSMKGEKIATAKALALAMASVARAQKRPMLFAAFSGSTSARFANDTPDEIVDWCSAFLGGGTDMDVPLVTVPQRFPQWQHSGRADHIIITDAVVGAKAAALVPPYREWAKRNKVRTFAIVVGPQTPGILADVADGGCWCVPSLDLNSAAVETVLSIGPTNVGRK